MSIDSLYLSPHLDDAVLSCAARIREDSLAGQRVIVATLFTNADAKRESLYRERRAEDIRAVESLGASVVHLGLTDAPFRRSHYSSFEAIVLGSLPTDGDDELHVREAIRRVVEQTRPSRTYCPLGVGTHIDHRLTYQAAVALGLPALTFYEDRPYVLVAGHLVMRLAELGFEADVPVVDAATFLASFRGAPYVCMYLGAERATVEARLLSRLPAMLAGVLLIAERTTTTGVEEVLSAIGQYRTQLADLYGDAAGLRRECQRYTAELGGTGYAERYWRFA